MKQIDKTPPVPTGNPQTDISAVITYLYYMREQINFILNYIERREGA